MLSMAVANHVLWPLAKFVNAKLVPKQHQPVANKVVQVSNAKSRVSNLGLKVQESNAARYRIMVLGTIWGTRVGFEVEATGK